MLIITDSFWRKELKPLKKYYTIDDIKKTAAKVSANAIHLSHLGYKYGNLIKLRMSHQVAGRMIVYVFAQKNQIVPIALRLKKDKILGTNLSTQNTKAKATILKRLDQAMNDIEENNYRKYN